MAVQRHLQGMMVRQGMTLSQEFEVTHLTHCVTEEFANSLKTFRDSTFGYLPRECETFDCSVNTLGHLYYAAVIIERAKQIVRQPGSIIEFGSGYGNLARIFKHFLPETNLILIDLPELLALQYLFLRSELPNADIIIEQSGTFTPKAGAIHLVPVHYMKEMTQKADLFVSTFALSETPAALQLTAIEKRFFNSSLCYISGQLHGAAPEHGWVHHSYLQNGIRSCYPVAQISPFHVFQNGVQLYSAIGTTTVGVPVGVSVGAQSVAQRLSELLASNPRSS